ncbi:MAG: class I SAM-dependent methyltransferase [Pirellulaceae bacterium]|nr:class I SAM-dependent methyltransferase [Pirellulaceae bacterium]
MDSSLPPESRETDDWDRIYREGLPSWETGKPSAELIRLFREHKPLGRLRTVLELGCGTGADAVFLAKAGLDVTAVEISPIALERARFRAREQNAPIHFVLDDVFGFTENADKFDLIHDAGFYDFARKRNLAQFLDLLWRLTQPGSYYIALPISADDESEEGAMGVTEHEIRLELGRLFETVELRSVRFERPNRPEGCLGWSCLMRRPQPVGA